MPFSFFRNLFGGRTQRRDDETIEVSTTYFLRTQLESATPRQLVRRYRDQFRTHLVGTWYAANGTFNALMNERIIFYADHTGRQDNFGPFGCLRDSTFFEWQEVADYTIRLNVARRSGDEEASDEDEPEPWDEVRYDFGVKPTDFGEEVILRQILPDGTLRKEGFWDSMFDLGYSGPPVDVNEEDE